MKKFRDMFWNFLFVLLLLLLPNCSSFPSCRILTKSKVNLRNLVCVAENDDILSSAAIWNSRRKISSTILSFIVKDIYEKPQKPQDSSLSSVDQKDKNNNNNAVFTAFLISFAAIALRIGGRGIFVKFLGIDFAADSELTNQINSFITYFQNLAELKYVYFFIAWFIVKFLCIDALTIVLAISSGVLFNGLVEGTAVSVIFSSLSSLILFLIARF
jgi:hypothetical protein